MYVLEMARKANIRWCKTDDKIDRNENISAVFLDKHFL